MSGPSWPFGDDTLIQWEQENPKRPGSKSYDRYEIYKFSRSLREAKKNGAGPQDFKNDSEKGFLKILQDKPPAQSSVEAPPAKKAKKDQPATKDATKEAASLSTSTPAGTSRKASDTLAGTSKKTVEAVPKAAVPTPNGSAAPASRKRKAPGLTAEVASKEPKKADVKDEKPIVVAHWWLLPSMLANRAGRSGEGPAAEASIPRWWAQPSTLANRACGLGEGPAAKESKAKVRDGRRFKLKSKLKKEDKKDKKDKKHKKEKKHEKDATREPHPGEPHPRAAKTPSRTAPKKVKFDAPTITDSQGLFLRTQCVRNKASSQFLGVTESSYSPGKWKATWVEPSGVPISLGTFDSEEEAARAFADAFKNPEARKLVHKFRPATGKAFIASSAAGKDAEQTKSNSKDGAHPLSTVCNIQKHPQRLQVKRKQQKANVALPIKAPAAPSIAAKAPTAPSNGAPKAPAALSNGAPKAPAGAPSAAIAVAKAARPPLPTATALAAAAAVRLRAMEQLKGAGKATDATGASKDAMAASKESELQLKRSELQRQIDELDDDHMEEVLAFLADDAKARTEEHYELDFSKMPMVKLIELHRIVNAARAHSTKPASSPAPAGVAKAGQPVNRPTDGRPPGALPPPPHRRPPPAPEVPAAVKAVSNGNARPSAAKSPGILSRMQAWARGGSEAPEPPKVARVPDMSADEMLDRELALRRRMQQQEAASVMMAMSRQPQDYGPYGHPSGTQVALSGHGVPGMNVAGLHPHSAGGPPMGQWQVEALPPGIHLQGNAQTWNGARHAGARSQDWRHDQAVVHPQPNFMVSAPLEEEFPWLGEEGGWAPGSEPPNVSVRDLQMPQILGGDTQPPGPCDGKCPCGQNTASMRAGDAERPWKNSERMARLQAALTTFQSHAGVVRRGRVSGQRRFEPAMPGWHERARRQAAQPQQNAPSLHPNSAAVIVESPQVHTL